MGRRGSQKQLDRASAQDQLAINDIVYAELSIGYRRVEQLDAMIAAAELVNAVMPRPALFLAGKRFNDIARRMAAGQGCCPISLLAPTLSWPPQCAAGFRVRCKASTNHALSVLIWRRHDHAKRTANRIILCFPAFL